jgi:hypothetical protein
LMGQMVDIDQYTLIPVPLPALSYMGLNAPRIK